jgi:hypothetical protein
LSALAKGLDDDEQDKIYAGEKVLIQGAAGLAGDVFLGSYGIFASALSSLAAELWWNTKKEEYLKEIKENNPDFQDIAESIGDKVKDGFYYTIERPVVQDAIRNLGFDGFYVSEGGIKNIAVFDPRQVKSAMSDPDIMEQFIKDRTAYRGLHTAPNREFGAPLHDLAAIYPDDVYSANAARFYGHGGDEVAMDRRTVQIAPSLRGKPDAEVTIYRAVPKDEKIKDINAGDWVTINKQYADLHGNSALQGNYKILERKVKAKDIYTNADSIHEYGYDPDDVMAQFLKGK